MTGTISYDAASQSYTLGAAGRSLTFLPADLDASATTETLTVYKKVSGSTTDTLTLTKPGAQGLFTYTYVGGAFWQRTVEEATAISGSFDAFAYGVRTPNSAIPRIGRAEYDVDLIGIQTLPDNIFGVTGQGTMQVDFGIGAVVTTGTLVSPIMGEAVFSSEARITSGSNAFSGTFRYYDFDSFTGSLNGAFYGPAAQEVGAAYAASGTNGSAAVGVIVGRGASTAVANSTVYNPTVNEFFANDTVRFGVTITGASGMNATSGTFSNGAAGVNALIVSYNADMKSYSLLAPTGSAYFGPAKSSNAGTFFNFGGGTLYFLSNSFHFTSAPLAANASLLTTLQYVRAARWNVEEGLPGGTSYVFNDFTFGVRTPDAATPRTGSGGFVVGVRGTAADDDFVNLVDFSGTGNVLVNFGTGALTGGGFLDFREDYEISGRPVETATGQFSLSGALSSNRNAFSGTFGFDGIGTYSGPLTGGFYGPTAQEMGATFSAKDGSGGVAIGTMVGKVDPELTQTVPPLTDLQGYTRFAASGFTSSGATTSTFFAYDPATQTYSYYGDAMPTNAEALSYRLGPSQLTSSDRTYSHYAGSGPAGQHNANSTFTASLLNPGANNPRIALTYTSYADVTITGRTTSVEREFAVFGNATPEAQMPRSGTGSYAGIVFGAGDLSGTPLEIDGTSALQVDFGGQTFTTALTIRGRESGASASTSLGVLNYDGYIAGAGLFGDLVSSTDQGSLLGHLYGPNAAEFGFVFEYDGNTPNGRLDLKGGAVGKRQ